MLVLDPKTRNMDRPVKTIPFRKGVDAIAVMSQTLHPELRAAAEETLSKLTSGRQELTIAAYAKVSAADKIYLDAVDAWEAGKTPANAVLVAKAQQVLAKAEDEYRQAMYPHRAIKELVLLRSDVDYRTKDTRVLPYLTELETYRTTTSKDRVITVADKA